MITFCLLTTLNFEAQFSEKLPKNNHFQSEISSSFRKNGIGLNGQPIILYIGEKMVRAAGLEPALPYGNKILSLACLPIPPRPHDAFGNEAAV